MIADFHFLRPIWLLLLLPLPLLIFWWRQRSQRQTIAKQVIAPHLQQHLVQSATKSRAFPWRIAAIIWMIAAFAAAGPAWLKQPSPVTSQDRGYVILFDASLDTRATDLTPDRHTRLKYKALDLIGALKDGQTGLIAYSGDAFTISPLTRDPENLQNMLPALTPELMPVPGRNPLSGFQVAHEMLTQAGYQQGDIYWFSGSISREDMEDIRGFLRDKNHRVSVITAGTEDGAPVRTQQGELLRSPQGDLVIPRLFPEYFSRIAQQTGGTSVAIAANNSDINAITSLTEQAATTTEQSSVTSEQWIDMGPYLLWLALPFFLILGKQRQLLSFAMLAMSFSLFYPPQLFASNSEVARVFDMNSVRGFFRNSEQNALNAYQNENYQSTVSLSDNPMIQGMAAYRQGNYEQAATFYSSLSDEEQTAESFYNLGNSLAHLGKLDEAIEAYNEALARRPSWQQALENKEIVEQMKNNAEQEQQENDQQNENGQDDSQQSTEPQDSQDSSTQNEDSESSQDSTEPSQQNQQESGSQEQDSSESNDQENDEQDNAESAAQQEADAAEGNNDTPQIPEAWQDLPEEERAELEQLLRRLSNDPSVLLRNRLLLEAERRRSQRFN